MIGSNRRFRDQVQELHIKSAGLEAENSEIKNQRDMLAANVSQLTIKVQELIVDNILAVQEQDKEFAGNDYRTYSSAVEEIDKKYRGLAAWGVIQTATIIDLRAAFILGEGPKVRAKTDTKKEAQKELDFCTDFFEYNSLDFEMSQEIAKETEIEGKLALRLFWEEDKFRGRPGMVSVRYVSWLDKHYNVTANSHDYLWYEKLQWKTAAEDVTLLEPDFVYKKFGGRMSDPNDAQPRIQRCLSQIDRLDKALRDLREINHLFASPTPDFQVEDAGDASQLLQQIKDMNWRIGKAICHVGTFSMVSPNSSGIVSLIAEIESVLKIISGCTSIPIHYLGLLDLLKNRATGDNTRELVMAATTRERSIWIGAYKELIEKAMAIYNDKTGSAQKSTEGGRLDPELVTVSIPQMAEDHWNHIRDIYIPAMVAGIISKDTVAAQIPGVDVEHEQEMREEQQMEEDKKAQEELDRIKAERDESQSKIEQVDENGKPIRS